MIIIVVIILVILFLAFFGIFGRFPDNWEWVGIILAGIGITMAMPPILQLFWGHHSLRTRFENGVDGVKRFLPVYLDNMPVKNKILKKLGIKRDTIQSLTVQFRISEAGSGKVIIPIHNARIYSDDDPTDIGKDRISLPATLSVGACIMIVQWDAQKKQAIVLHDRLMSEFPLNTGQYIIDISLFVDGEPRIISRQFVVGQRADDLSWINPI